MRYGQGKIRSLCIDYINVLTCRATKQQPRIRSYFRTHQGIQMTLALLQGTDLAAQLATASLCQSLAFNDFSSGNSLLHHGAIPALLKALDSPNINVRRSAAGTLLNLQQCHQTSRKICEADGVRLTVNMFRDCPSFHVTLQQELAGVMCNIAVSDREGAQELTSTDAVELLVAKLTTTADNAIDGDSAVLQLNSALALRSIVLNSERVEAGDLECLDVPTAGFVAVRKHVDQILEIYREPVVSAKHSSAGAALCALAHFDARCREAIADLSHCHLALRWIAENPGSHSGDMCESVLVLLQSVTEASEECRQALLQLAPLEAPAEAEVGGAEGAVEEHNAAMQLTSDYVDSSISGWAVKELLALTENSSSPNVKWFAARCLFALTFNEERVSRCLLDLDGASRVMSLLRQHSDSLAHQELCWTLANAFHCARRRGGQQPTLAEDDISLFAQLLQSDNVKLATRFAAVAILASVLPAAGTEAGEQPGSLFPELLARLRAVSHVEVQFYAAWALAIASQVQPEWLTHAKLRAASAAEEALGSDLRQTMSAVGASVLRFHRHAGQQALAALEELSFSLEKAD
ncbi:HEAT repeat-containing protein [Acanthamoeba castellanii str. Neff]|uniref:HEAT repeat-containing protein n=1 Tax=Acanthamoeba castellanii (strain ATCC 30010 / Neff) TaxID=1257118 RepID=L8H6V7_ACACF|nr:HEAT repeat-containing protein [Acanthamoeba castellanii str. Neff]ELR21249.1 HEAT repeat-containing protein [Acanthamoeba castellanii str. Neff]